MNAPVPVPDTYLATFVTTVHGPLGFVGEGRATYGFTLAPGEDESDRSALARAAWKQACALEARFARGAEEWHRPSRLVYVSCWATDLLWVPSDDFRAAIRAARKSLGLEPEPDPC